MEKRIYYLKPYWGGIISRDAILSCIISILHEYTLISQYKMRLLLLFLDPGIYEFVL
jgi:hypothetical protein